MGEIKLKGVKKVVSKGRTYYYHRKSGKRLESRFGTRAFVDEVTVLNEMMDKKERETLPGTWGALADKFIKSQDFANLSPRTQDDYKRRILDPLKIKSAPIHQMTAATCLRLRDRIFEERGEKAANYTMAVMSRIFVWGKPYGYTKNNPFEGLPKVKIKNKPRANRPWLDYEIEVVLREAPFPLKLVIALMLTGLRTSDAITVQRKAFDPDGFEVRTGKAGVSVWIAPSPYLCELAEQAPKTALTLATNYSGEPWTLSGLRSVWGRFKRGLEEEREVGTGLTFHGLRHTVGNTLAENGINTASIAHVLGHKTETMATHYSNRAERKSASVEASKIIGRIGAKE